jgi:two-component system NtrC family sensor kinase
MPGDLFAHVAFVGIIVQGASALLLALLLLALRRIAGHRPYLRDWSAAFLALAVALAALFARYLASESFRLGSNDFANAREPLPRALYVVYQTGKFAFFAGILTGAARFAERTLPVSRLLLAALLIPYAAVSVLATADLPTVVAWQTPVAIGASAGSSLLLLRAPPERRSFGTRLTGGMCALLAALWILYAYGFGESSSANRPLQSFVLAILRHNSFIDVVLQSVLAFGMVIALFQDLEREADLARAERARLQARLAESRHLESLGVVVSGVAHELNNPLTAILGYSEELLETIGGRGDRAAAARVIHEQALRCRSIVRDLLDFARPRASTLKLVSPRALVERVARGFAPALRRAGVELSLSVATDVPAIAADPNRLEQVLANLIDNAIDASPPGGRVLVAASRRADQCELVVADEGPGVPAELAQRIFEPFFTTKEPGRGTGLGLAVSRRIVTAHGGTIRVDGRADGRSGASFTVLLPARAQPQPAKPLPEPAKAPGPRVRPRAEAGPTPPSRVLVVDDEASVRTLLRRRLEQHGFEVVEAKDGRDALEKVRSAQPPFDAAITDLKMRGMSGYELHEQLAREAPALARNTVAITGDLLAPEVARFSVASGCPVFDKPLDLERLVGRVAELAGREIGRAVAGSA